MVTNDTKKSKNKVSRNQTTPLNKFLSSSKEGNATSLGDLQFLLREHMEADESGRVFKTIIQPREGAMFLQN